MIAENMKKLKNTSNWMMITNEKNSFFFNAKENLITFHPLFSLDNIDFFSVNIIFNLFIENLWIRNNKKKAIRIYQS